MSILMCPLHMATYGEIHHKLFHNIRATRAGHYNKLSRLTGMYIFTLPKYEKLW